MQQRKPLIDWEATVKSCFHGLGMSSLLLSAERETETETREGDDSCPEKFSLRRIYFEIGSETGCRCVVNYTERAYSCAILSECVVMRRP